MLEMSKFPIYFQLKQRIAFFITGHNSAFSYHHFMPIYQQTTEQCNLTLGINSHKLTTLTEPL